MSDKPAVPFMSSDRGDEVEYYDASDWGIQHPYQTEVLTDILNILPGTAKTILDVGCGDGIITNQLPADRDVLGLDISAKAMTSLRRPSKVGSVLDLPFETKSFDLVMANDILEHLDNSDLQRACGEIERTARDFIIITVPFNELLDARQGHTQIKYWEHVNRHKQSFDLERLKGLFGHFVMRGCVFSGIVWEDELISVEMIKSLCDAVKLHQAAPRQLERLKFELDRVLRSRRRMQASHLTAYPEDIDRLNRRTEVICFYTPACQPYSVKGRIGGDVLDLDTASRGEIEIDPTTIDFNRLQLHLSSHLPLYARLPVIVTQASVSSREGIGKFVANGREPIDIRASWFVPVSGGNRLRIAGSVPKTGTVSINHYDGDGNYRQFHQEELAPGSFEIVVDGAAASVSEYGVLFQIVFDGQELELSQFRLENGTLAVNPVPAMERQVEYLYRSWDEVELFVSTRIYNWPLVRPVWFDEAEWLKPLEHGRFFGSGYSPEALLKQLANGEFQNLLESNALVPPFMQDYGHALLREAHASELIDRKTQLLSVLGELRSEIKSLAEKVACQDAKQPAGAAISSGGGDNPPVGVVLRRGASEMKRLAKGALRRTLGPDRVSAIRRALGRKAGALSIEAPPVKEKGRFVNGLPATVTMLVPDDRIDRRVLQQARSLISEGVHVKVIAPPYPEANDGDRKDFPDVEIIRLDTSKAAENVPDGSATRLSKTRDWKAHYFYHDHFLAAAVDHPADVYVAHDLPVLPATVAAADIHGVPLFYDAHELYPEQLHFGEQRMQLYREVETEVAPCANVVTAVNQSIAEEMSARYGIDVPAIILNAPEVGDRPVPIQRTSRLRQSLGLGSSMRLLLFQGSLSLNRNLENLVAAMAEVETPDAMLVVMGPGDEKRRELEEIASSKGLLGKRVVFHDAVPQRELLDYTSSADIGIIPYPGLDFNTTHCTPNKLFEFMVAGVPILGNDLPELRRFVLGNEVGIVASMQNTSEIAKAVDDMLSRDLLVFRENLKTSAGKMVWKVQAAALLQIYRDFSANH